MNNNGGMGKLCSIAFGRNGIWAVTDYSNHCVHVFDGQDQLINSFGNKGNRTSQFINPRGIAFDESNYLYINHRVQKFDVSATCCILEVMALIMENYSIHLVSKHITVRYVG